MSFFKNMTEPTTNDISMHPGYSSLPENVRRDVNTRYETVYNNNQRLGVKIAQGLAYTAASQMCEAFITEKHIGFKAVQHSIEDKEGYSKERAGAIAASIGRKKYGAKAMKNAAKNHHELGEDEESSPDMMGEGDSEHGYDEEGGKAKGATYEAEKPKWADQLGRAIGKGDKMCVGCGVKPKMKGGKFCPGCNSDLKPVKEGDAEDFQAKNDAMVGMTEDEPNDYGVTQQAHIPIAHPQEITMTPSMGAIMYNPANAFGDNQGDPQDKGPKGIQKANHRMKGMTDTASQNEGLDPMIFAAAGYLTHRAEVSGIMESVEASKKLAVNKFKTPKFKPTRECGSDCYDNEKHSALCPHSNAPDHPNDMAEGIDDVGHGDRVHIKSPQGQVHSGKAVMRSSHGGWVLNMGGKHGTPGIADETNYVKHTKAKNKAPNSLAMRRLTGEEVTISGEYAKLTEAKEHPLHSIATENGFTKTGTKDGVHKYKKETDSKSERLDLGTKNGSHYWEHKRFDPEFQNSAKRTPVSHYSHGLHGDTDLDTLKTGLSGQLKSK